MTYNIKYDNVNDTVNNWNDRKSSMVELIVTEAPDVVGMQEVLHNQLNYLNEELSGYDYVGVGREDGKQKGEYSPILYQKEKYELLKSNTFWLSKTPDQISVGWDAALERICTYALLKEKSTDKEFYVFNTHFDHRGDKARKKSVKLILKKIDAINTQDLPVVLMGDLNLSPEKKSIQYLSKKMTDGLEVAKSKNEGPSGTFNGFNLQDPITQRIDYIFTRGFSVSSYEHIDERLKSGKHISDHLPVKAELVR
ncbi:endonuclease/exonuclease/phosphatase family protein [Euzebyella marina]|uniref:Endonuclease/exonuclease/phosphatase family protein n=1 Tax=Euzebyella marina TaxID=1761453 RepID=A0A3G2L6H3_9FLAO|nr:endonuclease/exonuclease/phosphatase family protein [Euzebyella marina]AYN67751.1 endonuclease/exonuclease/phosphatase family protein [Euzebyella marina]